MNYWLVKSEDTCYSIDDLKRDRRTDWTGIRNYQSRNFMRDKMLAGDLVLFYHSNSKPNGVYGIAKVASKPHADPTQFASRDDHFDATSKKEDPRWFSIDMAFVSKFKEPVTLAEIKFDPALAGMLAGQQGSRLSVQPVSEKHFKHIVEHMAKR